MQTWTMPEIYLGMVGRIREYGEDTDVEVQEGQNPPANWPSKGSIDIEDVSVTYAYVSKHHCYASEMFTDILPRSSLTRAL